MPLPSLSLRSPSTQVALATSIRLRLQKILEDSLITDVKLHQIVITIIVCIYSSTARSSQHGWISFCPPSNPLRQDACYPHFTEEGTEAQQSEMTCQRSHSK